MTANTPATNMTVPTSPSITLLDLPIDVQNLIIDHLRSPVSPLSVPSPTKDEVGHTIGHIMDAHYHKPTENRIQCSKALLNWSSTCWHFRKLIRPHLFKTVVLRPRESSKESFKALAQSDHWSCVEHFVFICTDKDGINDDESRQDPDDDEEDQSEEQQVTVNVYKEIQELSNLLSALPPNLASITLDLSKEASDWSLLCDGDYFTDDKGVARAERTDWSRGLLYTVLNAVSRYDISAKPDFRLNLCNVQPVRCSIFEQPRFRQLLNRVTSFGLSLYDPYIDVCALNVTDAAELFAEKLDEWFLNHLVNTRSLRLHATESWPLGLAPGHCHLKLPLPTTSQLLAKIEHVSFAEMFIGPEITDFLVHRANQLQSIELIDCYCAGMYTRTDVPNPPTWAEFFDKLVEANFQELTTFLVRLKRTRVDQSFCKYEEFVGVKDHEVLREMLTKQREEDDKAYSLGASRADVWRRRRWVFPYYNIDDGYGLPYSHENMEMAHFLIGKDYVAYLKVADLVEANMKREGKLYFRTTGVDLPVSSRGDELLGEVLGL